MFLMGCLFSYFLTLVANAQENAPWLNEPCPDNEVLARDFLRAELFGWRWDEVAPECRSSKSFSYFRFNPLPAGEVTGKPLPVKDFSKDVKVSSLKSEKDEFGNEKVRVEFRVWVEKGSFRREFHDTLEFARNSPQGPWYRSLGCAVLQTEPQRIYVLKSCLR